MACIQESSLYGVVGQPLTQDYLARQLPIFQKKVPNSQPKPQFPTNAPPNLPLPPLYPGEIIQLQENRVVCTDTFNEPAVGAVYITNYRIIFYGNLISDPESMEALHDANWKFQIKKESSSSESVLVPSAIKPFKHKIPFAVSTKAEPSFKSFLVGDNQDVGARLGEPSPQQAISHTQRIKTGFKKFGSLRLSPRNRGKHPSSKSYFSESVDANLNSEQADPESSRPDGSSLRGSSSKAPANQRVKRKDIILNYNQDTVSLDSVSVNSTSEFSATGTDDRSTCSPIGDGENSSLGTLDEANGGGGGGRVCVSGSDGVIISATDPLCFLGNEDTSGSSYRTCDSGIGGNFMSFTSIESYGGSSSAGEKIKYGKGTSHAKNTTVPPPDVVDGRKFSIDFEKVFESPQDIVSESMAEKKLSERVQQVWKNSVVQLESDSDSENERTLRSHAGKSGSKSSINKNCTLPDESCTLNHTLPGKNDKLKKSGENYSKLDGSLSHRNHSPEAPSDTTGNGRGKKKRTRKLEHAYTNVILIPSTGNDELKRGFPLKPAPDSSRKRSKSSSPYIRKKPKPLPRKIPLKKEASKNEMFLSSLPADFKPIPRAFAAGSRCDAQKGSSTNHTAPQKVSSAHSSPKRRSPPNHTAPLNESPAHRGGTSNQRLPNHTTPKQDPQGTPKHGGSPNHTTTPDHHQGSSAVTRTPYEASNPTSPLRCSSTTTSTYSSSSSIHSPIEGEDPTTCPIPPPRRKRKSRIRSRLSSEDCVSPVSPLPFSPEGSSVSRTFSLEPYGGGGAGGDGGGPVITDGDLGKLRLSDVSAKSRDIAGCGSGISRDNTNNSDILSSLVFDNGNSKSNHITSTSTTTTTSTITNNDRSSQYSNESARSSLTVFPGSVTSTNSHVRPYSFISPGETSHQFTFTGTYDKFRDSFSGVQTLPRSVGASTWTPRGQIRAGRQSIKPPVTPASTRYSLCNSFPLRSVHSVRKIATVFLKEYNLKLSDGLLILCRNFHSMRLHIHPHNTYDSDSLKELLERKFLANKQLHNLFAFQYRAAIRHPNPTFLQNRSLKNFFHLSDELSRLGLQDSKIWTVSRVLVNHADLCSSYPTHVIVPICTGDLDFIRGAKQYHEGRFPTLTWYNQSSGAALLRAASTKDNRGQFGSNLQMDEALLQSISGSKLNSHGPPMTVHIYTEKNESGLKERNAEQVRSYYYHNCKFHYSMERPPTFGSVRHSFNKLQAMLENTLPDEDYLIALDTTRWLPRIGELLSTAHSICNILMKEEAHVLVCYESGWDRTTQLVSLTQLLLDPYYRTIDGFQILVQKEWVWFGHPFQLRHSRLGKSKEDGPLFLQWTDCVWQVMKQCPSAFEFNERFLMSMVEHSYSGIFGTFMTNNERSRKQCLIEKGYEHMTVSSHTISFWTWVDVINAAGRSFYNELYDPNAYKTVIEPRYSVPSLKLWSSHYCRHKARQNTNLHLALQTHLEELVRKKLRLETIYAKLAPDSTSSNEIIKDILTPPPLGSRDELKIVRSTSNGVCSQDKPKPVPPPKPVPKQYKYECIEEYLVQEGFDTSICKHLEIGPTTCQGSLVKVGAVRKNWLQRWFVLDFNFQYLAYFENQTAYFNKETPKGVIPLGDISKVFQEVKKKEHLMKNIFLLETPHRTYQIQAPTITTMYIWIACLELPVSSLRLGAAAT